MRKTAQQKLNEFFSESDATRATVKAFTDAAYENYGSHAYSAGWLESTVVSLIMQLPKAKREEMRKDFETQAQKQRNQALATTIKETV